MRITISTQKQEVCSTCNGMHGRVDDRIMKKHPNLSLTHTHTAAHLYRKCSVFIRWQKHLDINKSSYLNLHFYFIYVYFDVSCKTEQSHLETPRTTFHTFFELEVIFHILIISFFSRRMNLKSMCLEIYLLDAWSSSKVNDSLRPMNVSQPRRQIS